MGPHGCGTRPLARSCEAPLRGYTATVVRVAFQPDGRYVAYFEDADKTLKVWDVASGQKLHTLKGHTDSARGVAFSPDGRHLASASVDKTVKLWDSATGQEIYTFSRSHRPGCE